MPPAISDDEKSNPDVTETGPRAKSKPASYALVPEAADEEVDESDIDDPASRIKTGTDSNGVKDEGGGREDGDEDEDDLEEDEYIVEKILSHYVDDAGKVRFEVKWEGFEKKSDRTWEPEENLAGTASSILGEYFASIGGRDKLMEDTSSALKGKKRGRRAGAGSASKRAKQNGSHPADGDAPASMPAKEFKPPAGSWDNDVDIVDMYRDEIGGLMVYLTWKNGHKTQHPAKQAYQRCPQKILQFYESKINFKTD